MNLIFLGAPGSGKGTQAEMLTKRLGIPSISTGNILRRAVKDGTPLGKKAEKYMTSGQLVPDDIMVGLVRERLKESDCQGGFILDGFPRTLSQAQALEAMGVEIDMVMSLEVSDDVILRRLTGRRVCLSCGATYHVENQKPRIEDVCDVCGQKLVRRSDDEPETVRARLAVFNDSIEPVKDFYERQGKLRLLACDQDKQVIYERMLSLLGLKP